MASRKEYEMLFQLQAQLGGGFNSTFSKAQQQLASMQKEIQALSKTQSDISAYQKQQGAVEATKNKLQVLQQQYDNIQKEIKETGEFSSTLENKLLSKQQQIDKTSASIEQQTQKLGQMDAALKEAGVDTGNLEKESARLGTQMNDLKEKQAEAADGAQDFGDVSAEAFGAIQQAIVAAGIATALKEIYEAYAECVSIAGDFEEAMSNVEALSGANAEEMGELTSMAKELGATTKFTAQESADAMGYMAMAGWDTNDMLSGMDGVLQLAAASGEDLAMVSDIVTDSLSAFGLTAADTAHFSDVLAAAATNSNTNVSIMGETFKMSASVAGALGYSIEDVATAVGLMANSGVKGSIAGTALKNTFNGLLEGVTLTSDAFGEYEYSAVKADGTMKTFGDTIDELRTYFEQMTEAERVNNAMTIAGQRGYNGLLAILNSTDEDYASLTDTINNCSGAAERMAAIKLDNMNGELTLAKSAWDALETSIGEAFIPVMREVYSISADVFGALNEFVEKHPELVRAVAAFAAVIGTVVVGLTAYAAIAKVAAAVSALLAAAIPGVNVIMGVTAGVAAITAGIVAFVGASDDAVPSVKELTDAAQDMSAAMSDADASFEETATQAFATAQVADTYISKLEEIEAATNGNVSGNEEYKNTLTLLARAVPELADSIDLTTNTIDGGTEALRANTDAWLENAQAQAYQEYINSLLDEYNNVAVEAAENQIKLTEAQIKAEAASKGMETTYQDLLSALGMTEEQFKSTYGAVADIPYRTVSDDVAALRSEYLGYVDQLDEAEKTQRNLNVAIEDDNEALAEAETVINDAKDAYERLTGVTEEQAAADAETAAQSAELSMAIESTTERMAELTEAYTDAYNAAYESISGQYALWDEAAQVVATSAGSINSALESQITYWQDYNSNLQSLTDRTSDIEGLSDMIATFADGSEESVNAIAGMAGATDEQLAEMVANWQTLQQEQEAASGSIADLKTDFTATMDELQQELASDIEAMNLSEEAKASGEATIQGFINAATSMLPQVTAAYASVANAARNALSTNGAGTAGIPGYAVGTQSAEPGFALVGEHGPELVYFGGGEQVFTAEETAALQDQTLGAEAAEIVAIAPQLLSAINAISAVPTESFGGGSGDVYLTVAPTYTVSGVGSSAELEAVLRAHDGSLRDLILEIIEEYGVDAARRAYT